VAKQQSNPDGKKLRLTVFLIKDGYKKIEDFLEVDGLQSIAISEANADGTLFFKTGFASVASWAAIFASVHGFNPSSIVNRHSRGLYVLKERGRWFCFTFGYTRQLIDEAAVERNFGLIVSLNLGDPSAIKAIEKINISQVGLQSREQAGKDIAFDGFEFNTDIDLLKSMTAKGPPRENEEQETYSGRDSFSVYTRITLESFSDLARRLFKAFQNTGYRQRYPWIDKISEERDPKVIAELESGLVAAINADHLAKIWMAIPEIVDWEQVENFAYRIPSSGQKKAGPALYPDIDLEAWLDETRLSGHVTIEHLRNRKVFQCYKDGREPSSWRVLRCLNAEIDLGQKKYILNDGDWYNVDASYVTEVDKFYRSVKASTLSLPNFGVLTEPKYLAAVPKTHPQYALMDRKNVMIGGSKSRVEFCDLYSQSRDIVHVKQYGGSSLLSHLFNQAVVSASCFMYEPTFRVDVNKLLPPGFKLKNAATNPVPSDYTVCIAVMSKAPGALELPFFSKVTFNHAVKITQRMNFHVTKLKIDR
jgi:uncharacterized protein (TIGR04141 family)